MVFSTHKMLLMKIIIILWLNNVIPTMMVLFNSVKFTNVSLKLKTNGEPNTVVLISVKLSVNVMSQSSHVKVLGIVKIS